MVTITEDYVSFEVAKLLKEKGFDSDKVGCYGGFYSERYYESGHGIKTQSGQEVGIVYDDLTNSDLEHDEYLRPTLQMAMKWLREVHNIQIELNWDKGNQLYSFQIWKLGKYQPEISSLDLWRIYKDDNYLGEWNYEEAVEEAIKYCLENLI